MPNTRRERDISWSANVIQPIARASAEHFPQANHKPQGWFVRHAEHGLVSAPGIPIPTTVPERRIGSSMV
jgi:hypothetical protein